MGATALLAGCGVPDMVTGLRQGLHFFVANERLVIRGEVIGRTPAAFVEVLNQNPLVTTLVLQDMSGKHNAAAVQAMGYEVRRRGLSTGLQSDSAIHGGAVYLFLSGVQRSTVSGAEIGVGPPEADADERKYLNDMLGSDRFYEFVLQASPSDGIHVMTKNEVMQYGLLTVPVEQLN